MRMASSRAGFIARVDAALETHDAVALKAAIVPLHESELGDLLRTLDHDQRQSLVRLLPATSSTSRR